MAEDLLLEAYVGMITEAPVDDIGQIRSGNFTTKHPEKSKFKPGDKAALGHGAHDATPALKKFPIGTVGSIVGMQHNSGANAPTEYSRNHGSNRYYIKMPDGKIYPAPSQCLVTPGSKQAATPPPPNRERVPLQTAAPVKNTALDVIIDSVDLVDFLHTIREYFYQLPPQQQQQMANYLRDSISPE